MDYGHISGIDKPISRIVQGTGSLSEYSQADAFALLDGVFAGGCTAFDTARVYGRGECERIIGAWIRDRGVRDQVVLIDKGAHPTPKKDPRVSREDIIEDFRLSFDALGFDYVDIYLLHRDDPAYPVGELVEVLNEYRAAGKIGVFGGSNWTIQRIEEANEYAYAHNLQPFTVSSPNFSLAVQHQAPWAGCLSIAGKQGKPARDWYIAHDMPLITWSSVAGGFFSGRYNRENIDTLSEPRDVLCKSTYGTADNFGRLDRASELAERRGVTLPQIALAYVLSQPLNIFAAVGSATVDEYQVNAEAVSIKLRPDEIAWLENGMPEPTA